MAPARQSRSASLVHALESNAEAGKSETPSGRLVAGFDFSKIPLHAPAPGRPQAKLTVNAPGDIYEREADRVAEQVMRIPEPGSRHALVGGNPKPAAAQNGRAQVQTKSVQANEAGADAAPPIVDDVLRSSGQPLDMATRAAVEPRFGHDFSRVRVHTDARAAEAASAVNARAFTVNHDIVFGAGEYMPQTDSGRRLLSHELTHVLQQDGGARSRGGHSAEAGVVENAGRTLQREQKPKQPDKKAGNSFSSIDYHAGYQIAFQNAFESFSVLDKLKQPIAESLAQGYLSRPSEVLKPVYTTLPVLPAVASQPSYSDVYNAIYDVLVIAKLDKGGKATDWVLEDVQTRSKDLREKVLEVGEDQIKDYIKGKIKKAAVKAYTSWFGERTLVGVLELIPGVGEAVVMAKTAWDLLELAQGLEEPAALSPAAQKRADIIAGVKNWLSSERNAVEQKAERRQIAADRKKEFGFPQYPYSRPVKDQVRPSQF